MYYLSNLNSRIKMEKKDAWEVAVSYTRTICSESKDVYNMKQFNEEDYY